MKISKIIVILLLCVILCVKPYRSNAAVLDQGSRMLAEQNLHEISDCTICKGRRKLILVESDKAMRKSGMSKGDFLGYVEIAMFSYASENENADHTFEKAQSFKATFFPFVISKTSDKIVNATAQRAVIGIQTENSSSRVAKSLPLEEADIFSVVTTTDNWDNCATFEFTLNKEKQDEIEKSVFKQVSEYGIVLFESDDSKLPLGERKRLECTFSFGAADVVDEKILNVFSNHGDERMGTKTCTIFIQY